MEDVESEWGYWLGRGDDTPAPRRERDSEPAERQAAAPTRRRRYEELLRV
jgi:hypothetical protein